MEAAFREDCAVITNRDIGLPASTTITAEERFERIHHTVLNLVDFPISISDTNVGGGAKIYDFPEGRIMIYGAIAKNMTPKTTSVLASTLNASKTLSMGVGTVQTTTQGSGTLATTQQDIVNTFAPVSSATINVDGTAASGKDDGTPQGFDGTTTPVDAFLNVGVPTATDIDGDATITVTGEIHIWWSLIGDY